MSSDSESRTPRNSTNTEEGTGAQLEDSERGKAVCQGSQATRCSLSDRNTSTIICCDKTKVIISATITTAKTVTTHSIYTNSNEQTYEVENKCPQICYSRANLRGILMCVS